MQRLRIPGSLAVMENQKIFLWFILVLSLLSPGIEPSTTKEVIQVPVGVVLNLNSSVGVMAENWMTMALDDFYAKHSHFKTRLSLLIRDSENDVVSAALVAMNLMNKDKVSAILGPQSSEEAKFVIELGRKNQVPIIPFSATSPSLSPSHNPFFIRTAFNHSAQVDALAAIVGAYSWFEVVLIYEDTEYGNSLIPHLADAFQQVGARVPIRSVISPHSNESEILNELDHLKSTRARIFVVHMTALLGSTFFLSASKAGMMTEGYGWIVTEGLSTLLDPVGSRAMQSMEGVLGVRPYIPRSNELEDLVLRMRRTGKISGVNLFGLWAYDTVWALAIAVEKVAVANYSFTKQNVRITSRDNRSSVGTGDILLEAILNTKFENLTGNFRLLKGELEASTFEVFNVIGEKERIIGYWNRNNGLSRKLNRKNKLLKKPIWPGDTSNTPPTKKLIIGVPLKHGFKEFLKFDKKKISGFSADIFFAAVEKLPFPLLYEFSSFDGTYDDLLYQIHLKKYDAVVGDTTIVANCSLYVDFTLPYSESGVSMIVLTEDIDQRNNMWIFLKPLSRDLWLTTGLAFIFTGFVIWALEHRENSEFRGPPQQQLGMIFWFSFSTLVFAHREKVMNNWSRFVLIIWVFVVLIITQSYTANLASMLTIQKLKPTFTDIKEIQRNGYKVGYQNVSFIKGFLIEHLNFDETKLVPLETSQDYSSVLSKKNKTVAAILDEVPYLKMFLNKTSCSKYTMVGPTYKTDGFGFAFPLGSSLVSYMSRAILNVTQDKTIMDEIESKYFNYQPDSDDQHARVSLEGSSLRVSSFGGLFIIAGVASMLALLMNMYHFLCSHWQALRAISSSERTFWEKLVETAKHFDKKDLTSHQFKRRESRIRALDTPDEGLAAAPDAIYTENSSSGTQQVTVENNNLDINENDDLSSGSVHI